MICHIISFTWIFSLIVTLFYITMNFLFIKNLDYYYNCEVENYKENKQSLIENILICYILTLLMLIIFSCINFDQSVIITKLKEKLTTINNIINTFIENELENKMIEIPLHIKKIIIEKYINDGHTCSICLSDFEKDTQLFLSHCGHLFHDDCIKHSINFSNKCPYCRSIISFDNQIDLNSL